MPVTGVPVITAPGIATDPSRPLPVRDALLTGAANSGLRFLADLAFPFSYPGGSPINRPAAGAPADGALIQDVAERANASASLGSAGAGSITYAGNGFDFTASQVAGATPPPAGMVLPASVLADLYTPFGGKSQRYLLSFYAKLGLVANWPTASGVIAIGVDKSYVSAASLMVIGMQGATAGLLQTRRQTALNAFDSLAVAPDAEDYGTVCQISFWRSDTERGMRVRSLTSGKAAKTSTGAVNADNTQDFSSNTFALGRSSIFAGGQAGVAPAFSGFRLYRAFVENLARSGRDPITVLDADLARQQARGLFS